jgi:hypothetical protein
LQLVIDQIIMILMSNYNYYLLKFDFVLSKHQTTNFSTWEINQILNSIAEGDFDKSKCLDFFVSQGILQKNQDHYYYMLNKTPLNSPYKNLPIIKSKIDNEISNSISFDKLMIN